MFNQSSVEYIDHMGDDKRACQSARVSLLNDEPFDGGALSEKDKRLLRFLMREKHTSPFEHSVISFRIEAPLPVVAQIMRHRTFSYNQSSRRYTADDVEFFDVSMWRKQGEKNLQCSDGNMTLMECEWLTETYKEYCQRGLDLYEWALDLGTSREQARFFLPQGMMARFWMTGNLHNYLKFLILRDDEHAQGECREVAQMIRVHLERLFPETMSLFKSLVDKTA